VLVIFLHGLRLQERVSQERGSLLSTLSRADCLNDSKFQLRTNQKEKEELGMTRYHARSVCLIRNTVQWEEACSKKLPEKGSDLSEVQNKCDVSGADCLRDLIRLGTPRYTQSSGLAVKVNGRISKGKE
jgi:hypothetical protein